jgi:hypothetical protein
LVKIIDVVQNHQRAHNYSMTMIRLSGSQLHAARVLVGLSRENLAERAGLCRHSIRHVNHVAARTGGERAFVFLGGAAYESHAAEIRFLVPAGGDLEREEDGKRAAG